jgi:hypothetical protein
MRKGVTNRGGRTSGSAVTERFQDRLHHRSLVPAVHPDRQERDTMAHIQNHQNSHRVSYVPKSVFKSRPIHPALSAAKPAQASLPGFGGGNCDVSGSMGDQRCSPGNTSRQTAYRPSKQTHPELRLGHPYGPDASQSHTYPQSDDNKKEATTPTCVVGYQIQWSGETSYPWASNLIQNQAISLNWHKPAFHSNQITQVPAPTFMISSLPTGHGFRYATIIKVS